MRSLKRWSLQVRAAWSAFKASHPRFERLSLVWRAAFTVRGLERRPERATRILMAAFAAALGLGVLVLLSWPRVQSRWQGPALEPGWEAPPEVERLRAAVRQAPTSGEARLRLAYAYLGEDRVSEAAYEFQQALRHDADNQQALLGLAAIALRIPDPGVALDLARRAVERAPEHAGALNALGLALIQTGDLGAATETFDRALQLHPENLLLLFNAARCAGRGGRWEQARDLCRRAAQQTPGDPAPLVLLVNLYLSGDQLEEADAAVQEAADRYPDHPLVLETLGRVCVARDRLEEARQAFEQAHRLRPNWDRPLVAAGEVSLRLQDHQGAVGIYERALAGSPQLLSARVGLAEALQYLEQNEKAMAIYEQILEREPAHLVALNNLAYLYAQEGTRLDRARELAERARELQPRQPMVMDTLAWIRYLQGEWGGAFELAQEALRLAPEAGVIHLHLGLMLADQGQTERAAAALNAALERTLMPAERRAGEEALSALAGGGRE